MLTQLRYALLLVVVLTLLTGLVYPLAVTGIAQLVFPEQANGSLIVRNGQIEGSRLIGQAFDSPDYFWPRPSATQPVAYNAASSSGSNDDPLSASCSDEIAERKLKLEAANGELGQAPPIDLLTASASGLDPHISPAAAAYQAARVAQARGIPLEELRALIERHTEPREFGFLGEPRVNVLKLNIALEEASRR